MKAAIYCPGPSLAKAVDDFEGLEICVNRSAILRGCDYWACGDPAPILSSRQQVIGRPTLFTMRSTVETLSQSDFTWPGGIIEWESLFEFLPHTQICWTRYTTLAAIVLAVAKGATDIRIFGCDWTHEADWDGNADALADREEHRWKLEREIYGRLTDSLALRGIEVKRVQLAQIPH